MNVTDTNTTAETGALGSPVLLFSSLLFFFGVFFFGKTRCNKLGFCFLTGTLYFKKNQDAPRPSEHPPVRGKNVKTFRWDHRLFSFSFSFISLIADGPHRYHPACGHKGSSHLSPVHALHFFYRDASSALLQLVNQWLNFTYSRSHAQILLW